MIIRIRWIIIIIIIISWSIGSDELKKLKEKHVFSLRVLKCTIEALPKNYYNFAREGQNPELKEPAKLWISSSSKEDELKKKKETPILAATRNGITEIVEEILNKYSMSIHDETDEGKNISLLAVENRQPQIYQLLLKKGLLTETMLQKLDKDGNNALHLAAKINKPWLISGATLQLQWEIKWYEVWTQNHLELLDFY